MSDDTQTPPLLLVECDRDHPKTWVEGPEDEWRGSPPCPWCLLHEANERHAPCEHSQHRPWQRWKLTRRAVSRMYALGIITGSVITSSAWCRGCIHGLRWRGKRPYILGWPSWKWRCLLVMRHWPGGLVGFGCCSKCLPCEMCGSTEWPHEFPCAGAVAS